MLLCLTNYINTYPPAGSNVEIKMYENMTLNGLVQRLILKRPAVFCGEEDSYKLITGEMGYGGDDFLKVGTTDEQAPLVLKDLMSYDEMKVTKT